MNDWFWHALWVCVVVIPVTILWGACIFDIVFRSGDLVWWKRLAWLVLVLVIPVIGALIYASVALGGKSDVDFRDLEMLHSQGALSDADYEHQRARIDSNTGQ